jgi:HD-GYP domain-containing protein (c-di-GMP phosphodiesterase class II)
VREIKVLAHLAGVVRSHHERFDGGGYPDGIAGSQVPVLARVLAVADSCDAMLSARPYRKPLDIGRIESILSEEAGKQWDPAVIDAFWACRTEIYAIREKGLGESVAAAVQKTMQPSADESATTFRSTEAVQVRRST